MMYDVGIADKSVDLTIPLFISGVDVFLTYWVNVTSTDGCYYNAVCIKSLIEIVNVSAHTNLFQKMMWMQLK